MTTTPMLNRSAFSSPGRRVHRLPLVRPARPSLSGFPGPVNLGNPEEISIRSLTEKIIDLARSPAGIVFGDLPEDDPRRRRPDISKARRYLQWTPEVSLEEGLKKTIDYFGDFSP